MRHGWRWKACAYIVGALIAWTLDAYLIPANKVTVTVRVVLLLVIVAPALGWIVWWALSHAFEWVFRAPRRQLDEARNAAAVARDSTARIREESARHAAEADEIRALILRHAAVHRFLGLAHGTRLSGGRIVHPDWRAEMSLHILNLVSEIDGGAGTPLGRHLVENAKRIAATTNDADADEIYSETRSLLFRWMETGVKGGSVLET